MNRNATIIISSIAVFGVVALIVWIILNNQKQRQLAMKTCYTPEMAKQQEEITEHPAPMNVMANYPIDELLSVENRMTILSKMPVPNYTTVKKCLNGKHQAITFNLTA